MTMPKTLAALPSSQYATLLDEVFGKLFDLLWPYAPAAASSRTMPVECDALIVALLRRGCVDFHLTDCKTDGRDVKDRGAMAGKRLEALRHGLQTKSRLESRGAAVRSWGKARKTEAMAHKASWRGVCRREIVKKRQSCSCH